MAAALTIAPGSCYVSVCSFGACGTGVGCCVAAPLGSSYCLSLNFTHSRLPVAVVVAVVSIYYSALICSALVYSFAIQSL